MGLKGAIACLSDKQKCKYCLYESENCRQEAIDIAIQSLEAWDKVLKDIKQYEADCDISATDDNCLTCNNITFGSIQRIIKKHLKEVEE